MWAILNYQALANYTAGHYEFALSPAVFPELRSQPASSRAVSKCSQFALLRNGQRYGIRNNLTVS
jgi:hypothetical protein